MATKKTSMNSRSDDILYVGAGQSRVTSIQTLAIDTLDLSWPNWRNYENPECCIIPPIFSYTNPDKSDRECQGREEKLRHGERAKHIVYKAILTSAQKNIPSPILVIHNLDLDRIRHHLPYMFPNIEISQSDQFIREYDFVLISPLFGLVVIEVKSSPFNGPRDFKPNADPPKDYSDGIKQLQCFADNFLNFLQECTGIKWPEETPVSRILFMPNLERAKHEKWSQSLGARCQKGDTLTVGSFEHSDTNTIKWYKDDWNIEEGLELLPTISKLLDGAPKQQISCQIYEAYASTIAALGSVIIFKGQASMKLDPEKLFENDGERTENQDPAVHLEKGKVDQEMKNHFSKAILPTRQQLEALKGPNRQFILGSAGTGKTIVLQEKALQLLKKGLKVLILAPVSNVGRYKELFDSSGLFLGYEVQSLTTVLKDFPDTASNSSILEQCYECMEYPHASWNHLAVGKLEDSEGWTKLKIYFQWMEMFDGVLIDGALDHLHPADTLNHRLNSLSQILTIMTYGELRLANETIWIALDPLTPFPDSPKESSGHQIFTMILKQMLEKQSDQKLSCIVLDKVMRSSESIFEVAYKNNVEEIPDVCVVPSIGHKIQGPEVKRISDFCDASEAPGKLWMRIKHELDSYLDKEISLSDTSIIIGGNDGDMEKVMRFLIEHLRTCCIPFETHAELEIGQQESNRIGQALSINYWNDVSSLEWPLVIFVAACDHFMWIFDPIYKVQRYRGCSRAITKLVEIRAVYSPSSIDNGEVARRRSYHMMSEEIARDHGVQNLAGRTEIFGVQMQVQSEQQSRRHEWNRYTVHMFDLDSKHGMHEDKPESKEKASAEAAGAEAQSEVTANQDNEATQTDARIESTITHLDALYNVELEALGKIPNTVGVLRPHIKSMTNDQAPIGMSLFYDNYSTPKGFALLICNYQFCDGSKRNGAHVDLNNLHVLFHMLGYEIQIKIDRASEDMLNDVREFVALFDKKEVDSCIIVVMTLGGNGDLMGIDGRTLGVEKFLEPVQKSEAMIGKPKLIIIQAERPNIPALNVSDTHEEKSDTRPLIKRAQSESKVAFARRRNFPRLASGKEKADILSLIKISESESMVTFDRNLPHMPDSIVIFSPTPSFFSWKKLERGSWFIQTICEVFAQHAHEMDIVSLLQRVVNSYSTRFNHQTPYLAIPKIHNETDRKWHFFPGFYSQK